MTHVRRRFRPWQPQVYSPSAAAAPGRSATVTPIRPPQVKPGPSPTAKTRSPVSSPRASRQAAVRRQGSPRSTAITSSAQGASRRSSSRPSKAANGPTRSLRPSVGPTAEGHMAAVRPERALRSVPGPPPRERLPAAPKGLSKAARTLSQTIVSEYELSPADLRVLREAVNAYERAEQARRTVTREGMTYRDRFGAPRQHPYRRSHRSVWAVTTPSSPPVSHAAGCGTSI
jgi:Phage terminase, small subunit